LEPETINLQLFYRFCRDHNHTGSQLAIKLNPLLKQWLALEPQRSRHSIDARPPYEVVQLIERSEHEIRAGWIKKAQVTRAKNKVRTQKKLEKELDPVPAADCRQQILL